MIFIGGGSLLTRAVGHVMQRGLPVTLVCCSPGDACLPRLQRLGVPLLETAQPDRDLLLRLPDMHGITAFSINNGRLLGDALLATSVPFFNIHNGLVQRYRGIAEVCIFAALCRGESEYGVTLHRLLPAQEVDAGPVVAQRRFAITADDTFATVMQRALDACQAVFEARLDAILQGTQAESIGQVADAALSYKDVANLCAQAGAAALARATSWGAYERFFPRLVAAVATARAQRI